MSRIFKKLRTWRGGGFAAGLLGGLLALSLAPAPTTAQSVADKHQMLKDRMSLFNLAADPSVTLAVNRLQCGATSEGETCVDTFGSPTGGGGFWPTGTPDQYMFSSGLQVSGIIRAAPGCTRTGTGSTSRLVRVESDCFKWSGDTTAALFFEGSGTLHHGTPITPIYNSLDPADLDIWPAVGSVPDFPEATSMIINDTSLFNDVLIGRKAASQQDSWVAYWDGDPGKSGGRTHPMGILAEQRSLAWNYPDGNEATIYLIYRLTNVTNNALFQRLNETRYFASLDSLPNAGWTFDSVFVAYAADPDVGPATNNQASGILPFSMAITYEGPMNDPAFVYPADLFHAPFFPKAPGIVGMKFLKSPVNPITKQETGLTALSLVTNRGAFPDAGSVGQAWRYMSLNTSQTIYGDAPCTYPPSQVKIKRACYLGQIKADVRVFMASGPMSLAPGQSATIAASVIAAATVATPLISTSPGGDNPPGLPSLAPGCNGAPIRPIEIGSGWVRTNVCPPAGDTTSVVKQADVTVIPGSLLGKALVAQSIFNNKFLLGFAPDSPEFYLVPGDNQVTVVWDPSKTDTQGDPFFAAASSPTNPNGSINNLYDPNYRKFDVEGYRIYRGSRPGDLKLIAQFDKKGTTFVDKLCTLNPAYVSGTPCTTTTTQQLNGELVQNRSTDLLANGNPIVIVADTALSKEIAAGTSRQLSDTGVPYAYLDTQVRNGFQYFYKVTAFDINSVKSVPSSLESAGPVESVVPRAATAALSVAEFSTGVLGRAKVLNPAAPDPTIDPVKGTFSGPAPASNALSGSFTAFASQLLAAGFKEVRIDSIVGDYYINGRTGTLHYSADGVKNSIVLPSTVVNGGGPIDETFELAGITFASDPAVRSTLQASGIDAPTLAGSSNATLTYGHVAFMSQHAEWLPKAPQFLSSPNRAPATACIGGSRWFDGANETTADPTLTSRQNGALTGMTIFKPTPFIDIGGVCAAGPPMTPYVGVDGATRSGDVFRRFYGQTLALNRAADVKLYWGATGVDSVIDISNNVAVPFSPAARASYGFLADNDGNGVLNHGDFMYVVGMNNPGHEWSGLNALRPNSAHQAQPVILPTDATGDLVADGSGFGLFIDGEPFLFVGPKPTSGVWTLRTYSGAVDKGATYTFTPTLRPATVPGLSFRTTVTAPAKVVAANADLTLVHTVPDPYYGVSLFDLGPANKELQFVNVPPVATIRIYSMSGVLVDVINHNDATGGGVAKWDLRNRSNQFVASGVYMFHVSTPEGKSHVGKFTVISSGLGQ